MQDIARGHGRDIPSKTQVRVVLWIAGEEQARTDLQDTIEILLTQGQLVAGTGLELRQVGGN